MRRPWARSEDEAAPELRSTEATSTILAAPLGRVVRIYGDIASVIVRPEHATQALEAEVDDGVDLLVVVWMGRSGIRGVEPGRGITVEGRVVELDGRRMMFNPRYELAPRGGAE